MTSVGSIEMETDRNGQIEIEDDGEELHDQLECAKRIPPWTRQITLRGVIASFVIGGIYSIIGMKFSLTTGVTPNLNVSAALLGYIFMRSWTKMLRKFGIVTVPFTRQENTMIQTCAVACYGIAVGGLRLLIIFPILHKISLSLGFSLAVLF